MPWTFGALGFFGRLGGKLAAYAFIAWLFLRAIEQTESYAPLALAMSAAFLVLAMVRFRTAMAVAARGVPVEGIQSGFDVYYGASTGSGHSNRIRRLNFTYEFEGQQFKGKSTWMSKSASSELAPYTRIPLVIDPQNPQRAYWTHELPELFEKIYKKS